MPGVMEMINEARDTITVRRVFGEPIERGDATIVPAAAVMGGAGAGEGGEGEAQGAGSGFGVRARPVGAYVIRNGEVSWRPAVDVMRIIMSGMVFAGVTMLVVMRAVNKRRPRAKARPAQHGGTLVG